MCPACFATLALATAGSTAVGGASALALRRLVLRRRARKTFTSHSKERKS